MAVAVIVAVISIVFVAIAIVRGRRGSMAGCGLGNGSGDTGRDPFQPESGCSCGNGPKGFGGHGGLDNNLITGRVPHGSNAKRRVVSGDEDGVLVLPSEVSHSNSRSQPSFLPLSFFSLSLYLSGLTRDWNRGDVQLTQTSRRGSFGGLPSVTSDTALSSQTHAHTTESHSFSSAPLLAAFPRPWSAVLATG